MLSRVAPVLFLTVAFAIAAESPSADAILAQAGTRAAATHRVVWVIFDASW